jgi:hypothetical protein
MNVAGIATLLSGRRVGCYDDAADASYAVIENVVLAGGGLETATKRTRRRNAAIGVEQLKVIELSY